MEISDEMSNPEFRLQTASTLHAQTILCCVVIFIVVFLGANHLANERLLTLMDFFGEKQHFFVRGIYDQKNCHKV